MVNALGWSRRCAAYFRTDGGKPALAHIMCATLISEGMNLSKWRLLSVVSVRDVFGGTCGIFWATAGKVAQFRACHSPCMLFGAEWILNSCLHSVCEIDDVLEVCAAWSALRPVVASRLVCMSFELLTLGRGGCPAFASRSDRGSCAGNFLVAATCSCSVVQVLTASRHGGLPLNFELRAEAAHFWHDGRCAPVCASLCTLLRHV